MRHNILYGLVVWLVKPVEASWDLAPASRVLAEAADRRLRLQCCFHHLKKTCDSERAQENDPFLFPVCAATQVGWVNVTSAVSTCYVHVNCTCLTNQISGVLSWRNALVHLELTAKLSLIHFIHNTIENYQCLHAGTCDEQNMTWHSMKRGWYNHYMTFQQHSLMGQKHGEKHEWHAL